MIGANIWMFGMNVKNKCENGEMLRVNILIDAMLGVNVGIGEC